MCGTFTYEQFDKLCRQWDMTAEEGYHAMCFVANVLIQNVENNGKYYLEVKDNPGNSQLIKDLVSNNLKKSEELFNRYMELDAIIYDRLQTYTDANEEVI